MRLPAATAVRIGMKTWMLVVGLALVVPACSKGGETCEKFVERSLQCDGDFKAMSSSEKTQSKAMLAGMCQAAFNDETAGAEGDTKKMMLEMYGTVRKKAKCVAEAKDCAAAEACDKLDD